MERQILIIFKEKETWRADDESWAEHEHFLKDKKTVEWKKRKKIEKNAGCFFSLISELIPNFRQKKMLPFLQFPLDH